MLYNLVGYSLDSAGGFAASNEGLPVESSPPPNADPTPASRTWTVIGPPTTTLLSGPAATTTERSATFTFQANIPRLEAIKLEAAYLASPSQVERRAVKELGMQPPALEQVVFWEELP